MKKFFAILLTVFCMAASIPKICHSGSLPAKENSGPAKDHDQENDKNTVTDKSEERVPEEKTKGTDREEPEYDMDFEIDFDDDRC